ncbi:diguanylate cyclase [Variovorax sp. H27-G14]|uniref:sensor domain-containing diguanylate cyclase n=1 Tax=Variovorax sp. H27-G14 TaxID=3111914 RepID=UPI0038FC5D1E
MPLNQGAPAPFNEARRLASLDSYRLLDTTPEQAYDDLTTLASAVCRTPIALISLVDRDRQWFKARVGLSAQETPRELAFCGHAILQPDRILEVPDAKLDPRFASNALVTGEPYIRFYAGAPLVSVDGMPLGTVCVIDREPRRLSEGERGALKSLARQVVAQFEMRKAMAGLELQSMTDALTELFNRRSLERKMLAAWDDYVLRGEPLSVVVVDLDHFKRINDDFGHAAGDEVLVQVARILRRHVGAQGTAVRLGGEEFCLVLPGVDAERARLTAEAVRAELWSEAWAQRRVTASFGVACATNGDSGSANVLLAHADRALYESKENGRDRVTVFGGWT